MNPTESFLYPISHYQDVSYFVAKSMAHIFSFPERATLMSEKPSSQMKSDAPVIWTAMDRHFASRWEAQLYFIIFRVFQRSMFDESVAIGMVVLLDLLADVYRMGTYVAGDKCKLILESYPDNNYINYAMAAFMLSYRLLSRDRPVPEEFWEQVMEGFVETDRIYTIEREFQVLLEVNSKRYPPAPISPHDPAYIFYYDIRLPLNPLIDRHKYLRTKWAMYSHIRMARSSRGETNLELDPKTEIKHLHRDLLLQFPPCYEYMMKRDILFSETRARVPELWDASHKEVHYHLEAERMLTRRTELTPMRVVGKGNPTPQQPMHVAGSRII